MTSTPDYVHSYGTRRDSRSTLWFAALVLGGVFFYLHHDFSISTVEYWAPWSETTETFAAANTSMRGLVFSIVAVLGAALVVQSGGGLRFSNLLSLLVVSFISWSFLSLCWSDDVRVTLIRLGILLITCMGGLGLSRGLTPLRWMELILLITGTYFLIGLTTELVIGTFRPWAAEYRFAGTLHPNGQGSNLAMFSLAAYCQLRWRRQHRGRWAVLLAVGLCFLVLTKSRTACAGLVFAVGMIEWVAAPSWKPVLVGLTLAWCLCLVALPMVYLGIDLQNDLTRMLYLGRMNETEGFNGRDVVWSALTPYLRERLWTGYGYEAFWTQDRIEQIQWMAEWPVREAHSAYLNTTLCLGLPGTLLYTAMLSMAGWLSVVEFRRTADPAFALLFGLTMHFLAAGALESNASPPSLKILLLCAGYSYLAFPAHAPAWSSCRVERAPQSLGYPTLIHAGQCS